ncbi:hypothetical protein E0Z10_g3919 [Xylaria hypoxylon]|uniref:Uncharacterized protein n=1 Tax=Xylaria hypoxylon TaxID=37992 RepID=A0A4Z0Z045_9PEZI|nr:hypothetical protein E0Z10_g3919 [Xylaria hypoxylon]
MCCGSEDDYYTVSPYRPANEKHHASVSQARSQRQPKPQHRGPSREEIEKRQRQAQATAAAQNYGWPTSRRVAGNIPTNHIQTPGNRDSIIEPDVAGGLAAIPGSDFRAVYDPQQSRQQPTHRPSPPRPPQRPVYYQQRFVSQQPSRMPPMRAAPQQVVRRVPQIVHQRPAIARKPVLQMAHPLSRAPQAARLVRRDSNGISECSDDEGDREDLRKYTVSPIQQSPGYSSQGMRSQMGSAYGRNGAF